MNRTLAFLGGCIPLRLALVYLAYVLGHLGSIYRNIGAIIAILMGISFITLWAAHLRQNAPEGGGITWWDNIRPIHGTLWILAGYMLLCPPLRQYAWILLLADVIVGLGVWITHQRG